MGGWAHGGGFSRDAVTALAPVPVPVAARLHQLCQHLDPFAHQVGSHVLHIRTIDVNALSRHMPVVDYPRVTTLGAFLSRTSHPPRARKGNLLFSPLSSLVARRSWFVVRESRTGANGNH
jgi:hypothetical protein